jgi:serine kinase of HPr protein (carbohydrate metabolism regulator)
MSLAGAEILHATTLARRVDGRWRGVLVRGPSGAGKSDLALRALQAGWRLVSDDRTVVWMSQGRLYGRAPDALAGLIEARGLGVVGWPTLPFAALALAVDAASSPVERMPEPGFVPVLQASLPRLVLDLREGSAVAKIALALAGPPSPGTGGGFDRGGRQGI